MIAARDGDLETVQTILFEHPETDPGAHNNVAIDLAASWGHIEVVRFLLDEDRVDPSANDNAALDDTLSAGHEAIAELLLTDIRVRNLRNLHIEHGIEQSVQLMVELIQSPVVVDHNVPIRIRYTGECCFTLVGIFGRSRADDFHHRKPIGTARLELVRESHVADEDIAGGLLRPGHGDVGEDVRVLTPGPLSADPLEKSSIFLDWETKRILCKRQHLIQGLRKSQSGPSVSSQQVISCSVLTRALPESTRDLYFCLCRHLVIPSSNVFKEE